MKIINLKANNVQRISVVDITPSDNTVILTGENGQGKTSILDSILYAVAGKDALPDIPIKIGEEKAEITLTLDDYVVTRKFTPSGSYLLVTNKEGLEYKKPQALLDGFIGRISFDPLEFSRMKPKEQFDTLKSLAGVDYDFEKADRDNTIDYETRHKINKEVKEMQAQIQEIESSLPKDLPQEKIDVSALQNILTENQAKLDEVKKQELSLRTVELDIKNSAQKYEENVKNIEILKAQIEKLQSENKEIILKTDNLGKDKDFYQKEIDTLKATILSDEKIKSVMEEISQAGTINFNISQRDVTLKNKVTEIENKKAESEALTNKMAERELAKQNAVASAKMPISELTFQDGKVFYKGVPFSQASSAEQLKVSTAIAMAFNPKLRVLRIKDGSLLDSKGFESIKQMAKDADFQIWIETCYTNDPAAIVISDGHIKNG